MADKLGWEMKPVLQGIIDMFVKGTNQHVMPYSGGWCVIDEVNQMVITHFSTREEAIAQANHNACNCEGQVLVHHTPCSTCLSTVQLPQRSVLEAEGHAQPLNFGRACSDFDPFLGFDEYYFEI